MSYHSFVSALAWSFLAGDPSPEQITARASQTLGRKWRWIPPLAKLYVQHFGERLRPRHHEVVEFLLGDSRVKRVQKSKKLAVANWVTEPQVMQPVAAAEGWQVPRIESPAALAEWLRLSLGELQWFADLKGIAHRSRSPKLSQYHYQVLVKRSGSLRLIESPKPRLKELQRVILAEILDKITPHDAAHGFRKGRSIRSFATPHIGQHVVLRMDLENYFPSFSRARIQGLFRTAGYPEAVADLLGGICASSAPIRVWNGIALDQRPADFSELKSLYARPHLPQGAPTSPALANLCTYRADCRLAALAASVGAHYTRYADDLAFSGSEEFSHGFSVSAAAILLEEGLLVNHRKTRVMHRNVPQRLAGVVTNECLNVSREEFDRLKATLTNCIRLGPESQNRAGHPSFREHLQGRVAYVESINPQKGRRLRALFDRINW